MAEKKKRKTRNKTQRHAGRKGMRRSVSEVRDLMQSALSLYQSGHLDSSENILKAILKKDPLNQHALNLLGVIAIHHQNFDSAILYFSKIIKKNPNNINANINLALALTGKGKNDEAITFCEKVLHSDPDNVSALNNMANAYKEKKDYHKAISIYQKIIEIKPGFAEAFYNMGIAFQELEKCTKAITSYEKAISINSQYYKAYNNLSIIKREQGFFDEAVTLSEKAISIQPDYPDSYLNLSLIKKEQGLFVEAVRLLEKALSLHPRFIKAYNILSVIRKEQGRFQDALMLSEKSLSIDPDYSDTNTVSGLIYLELSRFDEAENCFLKAIENNKNDSTALLNLGILCEESNNPLEARNYYCKSLDVTPDNIETNARLLYLLRKTCEWEGLRELELKLDTLTGSPKTGETGRYEYPFLNLIRQDNHRKNRTVALSYGEKLSRRMNSLGVTFSYPAGRSSSRKIKLGYLSADFRNHPVSHQILRLFHLHNRDKFEVCCFSHGVDDKSLYREKIINDCDTFVDIRQTSFLEAAKKINEHEIDILIDLGGYTKGNRLEICALRPAPVQVGFLGYPGTTGCDFMDYLVGDNIVMPQDHLDCYSEKIISMPHSFMITDNTQPVSSPENKSKKDAGLPEDAFIFGSFSRYYKIDIATFDLWMKILQRVPESIIWLPKASKMIQQNLWHEAQQRDVDQSRLVFAGYEQSKADHLARLSNIDLALDTLIYNGHTTTTDLLWAGVPVITITGNHFPSRVSASVLSALKLNELICQNREDFVRLAVELAVDAEKLHEIRLKLKRNIVTAPLFNTQLYVENFEKALNMVYEQYKDNRPPSHVFI